MVAGGDRHVGHGVELAAIDALQRRMRLVDGGVDDRDLDVLAAGAVGLSAMRWKA